MGLGIAAEDECTGSLFRKNLESCQRPRFFCGLAAERGHVFAPEVLCVRMRCFRISSGVAFERDCEKTGSIYFGQCGAINGRVMFYSLIILSFRNLEGGSSKAPTSRWLTRLSTKIARSATRPTILRFMTILSILWRSV